MVVPVESLPMPSTDIIPIAKIFNIPKLPSREIIMAAQSACTKCQQIVACITNKARTRGISASTRSSYRNTFTYDKNMKLLFKSKPSKRHGGGPDDCVFVPAIVIPDDRRDLQRQIAQYFHSSLEAGHGCPKTVEFKTRGYFWWTGLHDTVSAICDECVDCKASKSYRSHNSPQFPLYRTGHYQTLHIDVFKFSIPGSDTIGSVIVYDPFNHFLRGTTITSERMDVLGEWLFMQVFLPCGRPEKLVFDTAFDVKEVNSILKVIGTLGGCSWPYSHNGVAAERPIRFLVECMRTMLSFASRKIGFPMNSIAKQLFYFAMAAYNSAPIPGTNGITPFFHEYGRHYTMPGLDSNIASINRLQNLPHAGLTESSKLRKAMLISISRSLEKLHLENSSARALKYNIGKGCPTFKIGDKVSVTLEHRQSKLNPVANPNYRIISSVGHDAYRVENRITKRSSIRMADLLKRIPEVPAELPSASLDDGQSIEGPSTGPDTSEDPPPTGEGSREDNRSLEECSDRPVEPIVVGNSIIFKKRSEPRLYVGKVIEGDSSSDIWQIHCYLHQTSKEVPKINNCPRINVHEPIHKRKLTFESGPCASSVRRSLSVVRRSLSVLRRSFRHAQMVDSTEMVK